MFLLTTIFIVFWILICFYNFYWKRRNLPPGPIPLPLFGNTLALKNQPPGYEVFREYARKYGPIYTFWMGEKPVIIVTDFTLIHKTFVEDGDAYSGRNLFKEFIRILSNGVYGIVNTDGKFWQDTRRFTLHTLRNLGMGRAEGEAKILLEADELVKNVERSLYNSKNHIIELAPFLKLAIGSIINNFVFGFRYETNDEKKYYYQLKSLMDEQVRIMSTAQCQVFMAMPWARHLPYFNKCFNNFENLHKVLLKFVGDQIQKRKKEIQINGLPQTPQDVMDAYFMEIDKHKSTKNGIPEFLSEENLIGVCVDLFGAGQETIMNTMGFVILYLILDQRVQRKVQKELDKVTEGEDRQIVMQDKINLPYTNAVINEAQRLCNLLPHNVPHQTTRDVQIGDYCLKSGTEIVPQISCVLYDEKIFPDPYKFIPERFLNAENKFQKINEFIPFSAGKRVCAGESIAVMELFLFTANLLNKFELYPSDSFNPPTIEKQSGFAVFPKAYSCRVEKRHK